MNFVEEPVPGRDEQAMAADVSITAFNEFPISVDIPKLGFEVLVSGCSPYDPLILVAAAVTNEVVSRVIVAVQRLNATKRHRR